MANELGIAVGLSLTAIAVTLHLVRGTSWKPNEDISQEVLENRASTVPETDFPEPMNRSIGGGGAVGAVGAGEGGAELEEGEEEDAGFDPAAIPEDEIE